MWEPVRNIYATLVFKMKMTQTETEGLKHINVLPKSLELTQIKVLKGEETMDVEQMMIQSMANI
jgi:hypothetical protein